jgi:hypothetical protein
MENANEVLEKEDINDDLQPFRRIGFSDKSGSIYYIIGIDEKGRLIIHNEDSNCYYAGYFYPVEPPSTLNTSITLIHGKNEVPQQAN